MDAELYELAGRVGDALKARGLMLATAESCTGGWIGQAVTMVPGSSRWFDRGFVTYTNEAKQEVLGVQAATLKAFGAVSEQTVREMVAGTLARSRAQLAVAVSGIAGPDGGTPAKPVGTVMLAWGVKDGEVRAQPWHFDGDRDAVRRQTVIAALEGVLAAAGRGA
ncbi:MAG TPA: nicotinamide-nucleotide amidohydrolase family protein [Burkholderiales bacterium]|nr:nicotinamide-nucleotide amidohydrolase family protein [Burkholderiales bacterium]